MVAVVSSFSRASWKSNSPSTGPPDLFMQGLLDTMQVWLAMCLVESLASYGLSNYEWYLFAGLSIVMQRIWSGQNGSVAPAGAGNLRPGDRLAPTRAGGERVATGQEHSNMLDTVRRANSRYTQTSNQAASGWVQKITPGRAGPACTDP
jgi:hypothetical protein